MLKTVIVFYFFMSALPLVAAAPHCLQVLKDDKPLISLSFSEIQQHLVDYVKAQKDYENISFDKINIRTTDNSPIDKIFEKGSRQSFYFLFETDALFHYSLMVQVDISSGRYDMTSVRLWGNRARFYKMWEEYKSKDQEWP